jgi:hypothetical protein
MDTVKRVTALRFLTSAPDGCEKLALCADCLNLAEKVPVINLLAPEFYI